VSISSYDDTSSTKELDGAYDSEHESDVDMRMEDDVDAPDGIDLDSDLDMESDGHNEEEEDVEEQDEEEEDEEEDYGKEPRTISQGETVHTLAADVDTIVDNQRIMPPEQGQAMGEHTPWPDPPVPATPPQTPDLRPQPRMRETHPLGGLLDLGLATPQKPRLAVPSPREAEAAGNTPDVDVDQQLLGESADGDSLPDVPIPDIPLPDIPPPEARPDGSVGKEWIRTHVAE